MNRTSLWIVTVGGLVWGCADRHQQAAHDHDPGNGDRWSVTTWGESFEIFAEADPLIAGEECVSRTHVTFLRDFSPLTAGAVTAFLVAPDGSVAAFRQDTHLRPGLFDVAFTPNSEGVFELRFRVETLGLSEEIAAGSVRVGVHGNPGGSMQAAARRDHFDSDHGHAHEQDDHSHDVEAHAAGDGAPAVAGAELVAFLKEQQWKTPFRTMWTQQDAVRQVVSGTGRVRPVAGWETALTASLDGEVAASRWPFVGMAVEAGTVVFELVPRAGEGRSLAELEAQETEKQAALELARERLQRLEELIEVQATSTAEVEAARARVTALTAQHDAAQRNLQAVRGAGQRGAAGRGRVEIVAPFAGQIAAVSVTLGEVVSAGATLARVVQTEPFWVEVYLHPRESALLGDAVQGLLLRGSGMTEPVRFESSRVRMVSRAPVVNHRTGTVTCIFEIVGSETRLPLGTAVEADVLLPAAQIGIVVPSSAVVDDAGVPIVYVQVDGEGFVRREVRVVAREGDRLLVDGLAVDERLVTVGGATLRRASLVSTDVGHGHVH